MMRWLRRWWPRRCDERGSAAIFVVMLTPVLVAVAGLVFDGGLMINARMRVADDAEQASRAGAGAVDIDRLRANQEIVIDPAAADAAAANYLSGLGYGPGQYDVSVVGQSVQVTVTDHESTAMLGLIGIGDYDVRASATSSPETGTE